MARKLDEIVREYLIGAGDVTEHRYARLLTIAIKGLSQLHLDVSGVSKRVKLVLSDINTANLPNDYISFTKIGICGSDGNIHTLGWNPNMCLPSIYDDCGNLTNPTSETTEVDSATGPIFIPWEGGLTRNGEALGRIYGLGGGNNRYGYYKIDEVNKIIAFQSLSATEVWLEYLGNLSDVDGNYEVHVYDTEALEAWIYWKDIEKNRTYGAGEKETARRSWKRERDIAQRRHSSFTLDQAKQVGRKANKQSPKF